MTNYSKLTDAELNEKAASLCGWKDDPACEGKPFEFMLGPDGKPGFRPDYCKLENLGLCVRDFLPVLKEKIWHRGKDAFDVVLHVGHDWHRITVTDAKCNTSYGDFSKNLARISTELFCKAMEGDDDRLFQTYR